MRLEVDNITCAYAGTPVLDGISFVLASGTIGCVLGPSGCGKTTLLRIIAGFEQASGGRVTGGERVLVAPKLHVPAHQRQIGMVFQEPALFPHLDVLENVAFGLQRLRAAHRRARALDMLEAVGLVDLATRRPHELSGGQQQRVALARALAPGPSLLLLDEPLEGLAPIIVDALVLALARLRSESDMTLVLVEQHAMLALEFAPRAVALVRGKVAYDGPSDALRRDATRLASLIGVAAHT